MQFWQKYRVFNRRLVDFGKNIEFLTVDLVNFGENKGFLADGLLNSTDNIAF